MRITGRDGREGECEKHLDLRLELLDGLDERQDQWHKGEGDAHGESDPIRDQALPLALEALPKESHEAEEDQNSAHRYTQHPQNVLATLFNVEHIPGFFPARDNERERESTECKAKRGGLSVERSLFDFPSFGGFSWHLSGLFHFLERMSQ